MFYSFLQSDVVLAVLGLCCRVVLFSSCGEQALLSSCSTRASHPGGLLWSTGSRACVFQSSQDVSSVTAAPGL